MGLLLGLLLAFLTGCRPFLPQTCTGSNSAQKQICLMSRPIEAIAEINVWSDFCCGRQLVATYFYVSQEEGGAGLVSWGTLSGSDGAGLSGETARGAGWHPEPAAEPDLLLHGPETRSPRTSEGAGRGASSCLPHIHLPRSYPPATCFVSPPKTSSF